jgi:hypothetical protein
LALALGSTVGNLEATLTEEELRDWEVYDMRYMLPHQRMEYYMAQLTLHVASGNGGNSKISDFIFGDMVARVLASRQTTAEDGAEVLGAMTGSRRVIKIGQRRKAANG